MAKDWRGKKKPTAAEQEKILRGVSPAERERAVAGLADEARQEQERQQRQRENMLSGGRGGHRTVEASSDAEPAGGAGGPSVEDDGETVRLLSLIHELLTEMRDDAREFYDAVLGDGP